MEIKNALNVIKQTLDQAIKIGVAPNLETSAVIAQSFSIIKDFVNKKEKTETKDAATTNNN